MPLFSNSLVQILTDRVSKVEGDSSNLFANLPVYQTTPAIPVSASDTVPVFYSIIASTNDPDLEIGGLEAAFSTDQALQSSTLLNTSLTTLPTWVNTVVTTVPDSTQNPAVPWTSLSAYLTNRGFRVNVNWATLFNTVVKSSAQQLTPSNVFPGPLALGTFTASSALFMPGSSVNINTTGRVRFAVYPTVTVGANPLTLAILLQDAAATSNVTEVITIPSGTPAGTLFFIGEETDIATLPITLGSSQIEYTNTVAPSGSNNNTGIAGGAIVSGNTITGYRVGQYIIIEGFDSNGVYQQEWNCITAVNPNPPVFPGAVTIKLQYPTRHVYETQVTTYRLYQSMINVTAPTSNVTDVASFQSIGDRNVSVTTLNAVSAPTTGAISATLAPIVVNTQNVFGSLLLGSPVEFSVLSGPASAGIGSSSVGPNSTTNYVTYTNELGVAEAYPTLGATAGTYKFTATVNNLVTNTYTITAS